MGESPRNRGRREAPFRELSGGEAAERRRSGKPKASRQTEGRGQRLVVSATEVSGQKSVVSAAAAEKSGITDIKSNEMKDMRNYEEKEDGRTDAENG